ncbi:LysR family transcriptional regulator [Dinoroseobacter sp. S124A]|uniref:LysR family transcriptional regulator n=1 Tax=Dinoroseobacter sp. S124A TaxID=3415128 RepID=UPI003C7E6A7F
MDMQWLEDVLILLEEGNMSRAAARRNITQPAFSRRIRSFETWLGTEILARGSNHIEIDPALLANEDEIRALIERIRELKSRIARYDPAGSVVEMAAQHALISSVFPDIALHARQVLPALRVRLRPGNRSECVSMFLRGDTGMLLAHETDLTGSMPFDASVRREVWGRDQLIPVVGGQIRHRLRADGTVPEDTPAIVYPAQSSFGQALSAARCPFGTVEHARHPVCETAFSNGIHEMVRRGLGVGWLPQAMCVADLEAGRLRALGPGYGQIGLQITLYARREDRSAELLLDQLVSPPRPRREV